MSGWDAPTGSWDPGADPEDSGPDDQGYQQSQPAGDHRTARGGEGFLRAGRRGLPGYDQAQSYEQSAGHDQGPGYDQRSGYESGSSWGQQPSSGEGSDFWSQTGYGTQAFGQQTYSDPGYGQQPGAGQDAYSQPAYGQQDYPQRDYSQPEYSQQDYRRQDYGQPDYGQPDYGQVAQGHQPDVYPPQGFEQSGYADSGYRQAGYGPGGFGQTAASGGTGYQQGGYGQSFHAPDGFGTQGGYPQNAYGQPGYGQGGYRPDAYAQAGLEQAARPAYADDALTAPGSWSRTGPPGSDQRPQRITGIRMVLYLVASALGVALIVLLVIQLTKTGTSSSASGSSTASTSATAAAGPPQYLFTKAARVTSYPLNNTATKVWAGLAANEVAPFVAEIKATGAGHPGQEVVAVYDLTPVSSPSASNFEAIAFVGWDGKFNPKEVIKLQKAQLHSTRMVNPGPHGGEMMCGYNHQTGADASDCIWVTSSTFGQVRFFVGQSQVEYPGAATFALEVRQAVEVLNG